MKIEDMGPPLVQTVTAQAKFRVRYVHGNSVFSHYVSTYEHGAEAVRALRTLSRSGLHTFATNETNIQLAVQYVGPNGVGTDWSLLSIPD